MKKLIILLLLSTPCYAGNSIINLRGNNNTVNATQVGNQTLDIHTDNLNNSTITTSQSGGGQHNIEIDLFGTFYNHPITINQNSLINRSISLQQYCYTPCNFFNSPTTFNQY